MSLLKHLLHATFFSCRFIDRERVERRIETEKKNGLRDEWRQKTIQERAVGEAPKWKNYSIHHNQREKCGNGKAPPPRDLNVSRRNIQLLNFRSELVMSRDVG